MWPRMGGAGRTPGAAFDLKLRDAVSYLSQEPVGDTDTYYRGRLAAEAVGHALYRVPAIRSVPGVRAVTGMLIFAGAHQANADMIVGYDLAAPTRGFRFTAQGREHNAVMGEEIPLERIIGEMLRGRKLTLATAESCTGGLISHRITNVPGSSMRARSTTPRAAPLRTFPSASPSMSTNGRWVNCTRPCSCSARPARGRRSWRAPSISVRRGRALPSTA